MKPCGWQKEQTIDWLNGELPAFYPATKSVKVPNNSHMLLFMLIALCKE